MRPVPHSLYNLLATAAPVWTNARHALRQAFAVCGAGWHVTARTCAGLGVLAMAHPHEAACVVLHILLAGYRGWHARRFWLRGERDAARERLVEGVCYLAIGGSYLF